MGEKKRKRGSSRFLVFSSERVSNFSLEIRAIQPSEFVGTRGKVVLLSKGFEWVPDLRSFDKFREVGVSPYLGFIPSLSTLSMFESNEAVRGRLIGPKPWDGIDKNFRTPNGSAVTTMADLGC